MPKYIDRDEMLKRNMYGNTNPITHRTYAEDLIKSMPVLEISGTRMTPKKSGRDSEVTKTQKPRPCYVIDCDNRAIFHKWVKRQKVLLNSSVNLRLEAVKEECKYLSQYGFIQGKCEPVIIEEIYALIEYEDGRVDLVCPAQVRFVDRLINKYIFDFDFDEHCFCDDGRKSNMIKVDLNDPRLTERLAELTKLKESGYSDKEIQTLYDEQIAKDARTIMHVDVELKEMVGDSSE